MRDLRLALSLIIAAFSSAAMAAEYPSPRQGDFIALDFKFHSGELMKELKLHYTTVGEPTGQQAAAGLCRRIVRRGPAARRREILHHHSRWHRTRKIFQAFGRDEDGLSELQLRRHGKGAISAGQTSPRHQAS